MSKTGLSHREVEVCELILKGLQNREIAAMLFVTEKTVKFHITNIFNKKGCNNRNELMSILVAEKQGRVVCKGIAMDDIKRGDVVEYDPKTGQVKLYKACLVSSTDILV